MLAGLSGGLISFAAIALVFGTIVLVHEWGHMTAAKLCGVAVPDFSIGMGPSLWHFKWRGTRYHICAIPIGGFVQIAGLTGDDPVNMAGRNQNRVYLDELDKSVRLKEASLPGRAGVPAAVALAVPSLPEEQPGGSEQGSMPGGLPAGAYMYRTEGSLALQDAPPHNLESQPQVEAVPNLAAASEGLSKRWQDITGWQKAFILVAGVLMNFLLAIVVMVIQGFVGFPNNKVVINSVQPGMPAAEAGLQPGDVLLRCAGKSISNLEGFVDLVGQHRDDPVAVVVRRGTQQLTFTATPRSQANYNNGKVSLGIGMQYVSEMSNRVSLIMPNSAAGKLGIRRGDRIVAVNGEPVTDGLFFLLALPGFDPQDLKPIDADGKPIAPGGGTPLLVKVEGKDGIRELTIPGDVTMPALGVTFVPRLERLPPLEAVGRSLRDGVNTMAALLGGFRYVFTKVGAETISGPIGIFSILGQSAQSDWHTFLMWVILINLNLGIMNLLPLPALDGGRLVFVALSGIGIRIPEKREALVHATGMVLLLSFILLISIRDVGGLISGALAH